MKNLMKITLIYIKGLSKVFTAVDLMIWIDNEFDNDDGNLHLRCLFYADNFFTDVDLSTIRGLSNDLIHVIQSSAP
jgi:hypothetical protein